MAKKDNKQRLFEMMNKVNKNFINENNVNIDVAQILNVAFEKLKLGSLKIDKGGSNNTQTQTAGENSFVDIQGNDNEGNTYDFKFKLSGNESDIDGVFDVTGVDLNEFHYNNGKGTVVDLDGNDAELSSFNRDNQQNMFNVVNQYVGETPESNSDEYINLDEVEKIVNKVDSQPFGGTKDTLQNGKNYVDNKPINSKLRVDSPQLTKYVDENEISFDVDNEDDTVDIDSQVPKPKQNDVEQSDDDIDMDVTSETDEIDATKIMDGFKMEMSVETDPIMALETAINNLKLNPDFYENEENTDKEKALLGFDVITPNSDASLGEDFDYAGQEREYADTRAVERFKNLEAKGFDNLNDEEKEEYFNLWMEFKGM